MIHVRLTFSLKHHQLSNRKTNTPGEEQEKKKKYVEEKGNRPSGSQVWLASLYVGSSAAVTTSYERSNQRGDEMKSYAKGHDKITSRRAGKVKSEQHFWEERGPAGLMLDWILTHEFKYIRLCLRYDLNNSKWFVCLFVARLWRDVLRGCTVTTGGILMFSSCRTKGHTSAVTFQNVRSEFGIFNTHKHWRIHSERAQCIECVKRSDSRRDDTLNYPGDV